MAVTQTLCGRIEAGHLLWKFAAGAVDSIRPCYFPESRYELLVFKVHEIDGKVD